MGLCTDVTAAVRKSVLAAVTALSLFGSAEAKEPSLDDIVDNRKISLLFENPLASFDANAHAWYTATQLTGKLNDTIQEQSDEFSIRLAQLAGTMYLNLAATYYSHEFAHNMRSFDMGHNALRLSFTKFRRGIPSVTGNIHESSELILDGEIFNAVSGVNQVEYDTSLLWKQGLNDWDECVAFELAKLAKTSYILSKWQPQTAEGMSHDIYDYVSLMKAKADEGTLIIQVDIPHPYTIPGDSQEYVYHTIDTRIISRRDHDKTVSREELLYRSLAADALSLHTWWAIAHPIAYLCDVDIGQPVLGDAEIHPPLVNHYLTSYGDFFNVSVRAEKPKIELSVATSFGLSSFDSVRFGGAVSFPPLGSLVAVTLEPFAYLTVNSGLTGQSVGARVNVEHQGFQFWMKPEYNHNDPLENLVKGKRDGFSVHGGIEVNF